MTESPNGTVFSRRLREVRTIRKLSQRALGIAADLDPFVASTRINRYEQAVAWPNLSMVLKLAETLKVPAPLLFADDEDVAELLWRWANASRKDRRNLLKWAREAGVGL